MDKKWICGWSMAHHSGYFIACGSETRTERVIIHNNIEGEKLRLRFSNRSGRADARIGNASVAKGSADGRADMSSMHPVLFEGKTDFVLPAGAERTSDEIGLSVQPGDILVVSIFFPSEEKLGTANEQGDIVFRSEPGDYCMTEIFDHSPAPDGSSAGVAILSELDVYTETEPEVIMAFGDSITQMARWTAPFTKRLYSNYPGKVTVSNQGIGGNRLLRDGSAVFEGGFGEAALKRVEYDVLSRPGVTYVIAALGTNDLGHPGEEFCREEPVPSAQELIAGFQKLLMCFHANGIKAIGTTILPRDLNSVFTAEREAIRQQVNDWILHGGEWDAVIDFAALAAKEDGSEGLKPEFDCGDGVHPNEFGGQCMADMIDPSLFGLSL